MISCLLGLEGLERVDFDVLNEAEELLLGVFVFVSLAGNSDADLAGDVSDSLHPDVSVEAGVDSHILSTQTESIYKC